MSQRVLDRAAMSRTLPRARWAAFLVIPQTLLRVAPGTGAKQVDLQADLRPQQAAGRRGGPGSHPSDGEGEPQVVVHPDRGGAAELGVRVSATKIRMVLRATDLGPGSAPIRSRVERVPASAGSGDPSAGLVHWETGWLRTAYGLIAIEIESVECTSSVPPGTPTPRASPNRRATWRWGSGLKAFFS